MSDASQDRFAGADRETRLRILAEVAGRALRLYDLPAAATATLINLSENATYRVDVPATGERFALRVHRDGYHSLAGIASELAWLQALRRDGVVVTPVPLPGRDGNLIQTVPHPALPRPRHAVLFAWEDGTEPSPDGDLTAAFERLGAISARMHRHARHWQRPPGFERHTWDFEAALGHRPLWGSWKDGIAVDAPRRALFARAVDLIGRRLARYGKSRQRFGLAHADIRLANLLVAGDVVKVLDFDDCGFGWFLYDAATTVSFLEDAPAVPGLLAAWAEGYRREQPLSAEDEAEIPTFVMLRRLLLVAWIGSHSDTDLARSMGAAYSEATDALCEGYLGRFG